MDSITKNNLVKCGCCGIFWPDHPTENSTCWRYRPKDITAEQVAEVTRQDGLTVATLGGSANGTGSSNTKGIAMGGRSFLPANDNDNGTAKPS